jgi:hypothetical protein
MGNHRVHHARIPIRQESPDFIENVLAAFSLAGFWVQGLVARINRGNQPAGPAHGRAIVRVGRPTEEAYLVGLAVNSVVRPGEPVPAAHFDKPLQEGISHAC